MDRIQYLVAFTHDTHWLDFRVAELLSLLEYHHIDYASHFHCQHQRTDEHSGLPVPMLDKECAFLILELRDDVAALDEDVLRALVSRCVLVKAIYQLWSSSETSFVDLVARLGDPHIEQRFITPDVRTQSFSVEIDSFFRTLTPTQKTTFRTALSNPVVSKLRGTVALNNPQLTLTCIIDFHHNVYLPDTEFLSPASLLPAYFGRLIARNDSMKDAIKKYDLKKRVYLGPTSLDHALAFLLANLAQLRRGHLALDPFVGTGSILVALTHMGARCAGTDIDVRVLRGNMHAGKLHSGNVNTEKSIFANFAAYGLERPELIRLDNHLCDKHYIRMQATPATDSDNLHSCHSSSSSSSNNNTGELDDGIYDCIVTDPPYGIRAGATDYVLYCALFTFRVIDLDAFIHCRRQEIGEESASHVQLVAGRADRPHSEHTELSGRGGHAGPFARCGPAARQVQSLYCSTQMRMHTRSSVYVQS
jgi:tRNA G10  N-methylase Trm11